LRPGRWGWFWARPHARKLINFDPLFERAAGIDEGNASHGGLHMVASHLHSGSGKCCADCSVGHCVKLLLTLN
jgi:hypothetical protein